MSYLEGLHGHRGPPLLMCSLVVLMIVGGLSCFESAMPGHSNSRSPAHRARTVSLALSCAPRAPAQSAIARRLAWKRAMRPAPPGPAIGTTGPCSSLCDSRGPPLCDSSNMRPVFPRGPRCACSRAFMRVACFVCAPLAASGAKACCVLRSGWFVPRRDERILRVGPPPCTPRPPLYTCSLPCTLYCPTPPPLRPVHRESRLSAPHNRHPLQTHTCTCARFSPTVLPSAVADGGRRRRWQPTAA